MGRKARLKREAQDARLKVSLCMIVRNEEAVLDACLESASGAVDEICILDTGSTDRTTEIAERNGAKVGRFTWCDDFAAARNASLDMAAGEWILVLDADERLAPGSTSEIRRLTSEGAAIGYFGRMSNLDDRGVSAGDYLAFRLFRNRADVRFSGKIHEEILPDAAASGLPIGYGPKFKILHLGCAPGFIESRNKRQRNLDIALKWASEEPDNFRANLHVAEMCGDNPAMAEKYYCQARRLAGTSNHATRLYFTYGEFLQTQGRDADLLALMEEGLQVVAFPPSADLLYLKGTALGNLGRHIDAIQAFLAAKACQGFLTTGIGSTPATTGYATDHALAFCYERMGNRGAALAWLRKAAETAPHPIPWIDGPLGTYLLEAGHPAEAIRYLKRAIAAVPEDRALRASLEEATARTHNRKNSPLIGGLK